MKIYQDQALKKEKKSIHKLQYQEQKNEHHYRSYRHKDYIKGLTGTSLCHKIWQFWWNEQILL